jgi:hypothetical protein
MMSGNVLRITIRVIVVLGALDLATKGGYALLWLLLVPPLLWDIFRTVRPAAPRPPAARFTEPGEHRVVLQVPGAKRVLVIRELRRATGKSLQEAVELVDAAPVVVVEGLSEQSAELVADRLRAAGARALAAPIGE